MNLTDIVINNLRRRKSRVAFLLAGLAISTATAVALLVLGRGMTEDITHKLDEFGANIVIVPEEEGLTLSYAGISVTGINSAGRELSESDLARLKNIKNAANISIVAPKLAGEASLNGRPVLVAGVRFGDEFILKKWWRIAEGKRPESPDEIVAGSTAASAMGIRPGQSVKLGQHDVRVSGILADTGSQDDGLIFTDLVFAQSLLGKKGRLSLIELAALCTGCPIEDMVSQISLALPGARVKAMKETLGIKMSAMNQFHNFSYGVSSIIMLVAGLIVLTTMMSSVGERKKEIGLFRAVGYRRRHIMQIVLLEAAMLGFIGGALGFAVGSLMPGLAAPYLMHASGLSFSMDPVVGVVAVFTAAFISLAAGLYPATKAAGLDPAEALRDL